MNTTIALAYMKIESDYKEIINDYLQKAPQEIIDNAYYLAHVKEVYYFFDSIDMEYPPFHDDIFKKIIDFKGNAIVHIYNSWLGYCHPENFNFFCYNNLVEIITEAF